MKLTSAIPLMLVSSLPAFAQGTSCDVATPISGPGSWGYWGSPPGLQSEFSPDTDCEFFTGHYSRYFQWTSTFDGNAQFDTLGATWDTQLAVYQGVGCTATCVDYDYGTGSPIAPFFLGRSLMIIPDVQVGDTFLVRVGNLPEGHTPWIVLGISQNDDPCFGQADDVYAGNDRYPDAASLTDGLYSNLWVSNLHPDFYTFCIDPGGTLTVDALFSHGAGNLDLQLWGTDPANEGQLGSFLVDSESETDNESLTWTNPHATNREVRLYVRVEDWFSGPDCNTYDLQVSGTGSCDITVTTFCDPMDVNSTGFPTVGTAVPQPGVGAGVRLEATQGPPGQFGYWHVGTAPTEPGLAIGEGRFCLSITNFNRYGRYNQAGNSMNSVGQFDAQGVFQNLVGTSQTGTGFDVPIEIPITFPNNTFHTVAPGQTWYYQLWHREANGQSNFTNGLAITY